MKKTTKPEPKIETPRLYMGDLIRTAESSPHNFHEIVWTIPNVIGDIENVLSSVSRDLTAIEAARANKEATPENRDEMIQYYLDSMRTSLQSLGYAK